MSYRKCVQQKILFLLIVLSLSLDAATALTQEVIFLKLILNGVVIDELFLVQTLEGDIWISQEDLDKTRLIDGIGSPVLFEEKTYVPLSSISGLTFSINEKIAALEVQAPPELFVEQRLELSYPRPYKISYTKDESAFVNYALFVNSEDPTLDLSTEIGYRTGDYFAVSNFNYIKGDEINKLIRLQTTVTQDERENLRRLIYGDHLALSGLLGSGVNVGGFNLSKNYSMDPYFIRFPTPTVSGLLTSRSEVQLLLDGRTVRKESLLPGEFHLQNFQANVGLRDAEIVIKDAFGVERVISKRFYYSDRLVKKGLHEYSYSIGFEREDFGDKSFSYGDPVLIAFHNYGCSERFKGGYSMEASRGLFNIGPMASFLVSSYGVMDTALAFSHSDGETGSGAFLNYSFLSRLFNTNLGLRIFSEEYSSILLDPLDDKPSSEYFGSIGWTHKKYGSFTLDYAKRNMHSSSDSSRAGFFYSKVMKKVWKKDMTFFASVRKIDEGSVSDTEFSLGLQVYFGKGIAGSVSHVNSDDQSVTRANIQKSLPVGTGYGYHLDVAARDGSTDLFADYKYQNDYGIYGITGRKFEEEDIYTLSLAGGVGYINQSMLLSRPILDSFGKVKVDGLEGVRVYHFGNEVGRTNKNGEVIIPQLESFLDNRISIESQDIPMNYQIKRLTQYISPPFRGGSLVHFEVAKFQAISGKLFILEQGEKITPDSGIILAMLGDQSYEGLIGKEGEFYIENIPPGKYAAKMYAMAKECEFELLIPESQEVWVNIGNVTCKIKE